MQIQENFLGVVPPLTPEEESSPQERLGWEETTGWGWGSGRVGAR